MYIALALVVMAHKIVPSHYLAVKETTDACMVRLDGILRRHIDRSIDGESRRDLFMSMIEVKTVNSPRDRTSRGLYLARVGNA